MQRQLKKLKRWTDTKAVLLLFCSLACVVAVGLYKQLSIPPVHYDEAWFGTFAKRIAFEDGFWPTSAMNSYTGPVVHYILALAFKIFGPSLKVSRAVFLAMNLLGFGVIAWILARTRSKLVLLAFSVFFIFLPVSQFEQRIQLEVTSWFLVCYAAVLGGIFLWDRKPVSSSALMIFGIWFGVYSHILFFIVPFSLLGTLILRHRDRLVSQRVRILSAWVFFPLAFFPVRMGLLTHETFAFVLALGFLVGGAFPWVWSESTWQRLKSNTWHRVPPVAGRLLGLLALLPCLAACLVYFIFEFAGIWPYAQITGRLEFFWVPLNLVFFGWLFLKRDRAKGSPLEKLDLEADLPILFLLQVTLTGWAVLKATNPKYWMVPTLTLLIYFSLLWARYFQRSRSKAILILSGFILWNGYLFLEKFVLTYEKYGATGEVFRVWRLADSTRYYRPVIPAYFWLKERNCHRNPISTDDPRLQDTLDYVQGLDRHQNEAPGTLESAKPCPWGKSSFYFGSIENKPNGSIAIDSNPHWKGFGIYFQTFYTR